MDTKVLSHILEVVCHQQLYDTFNELSLEPNLEDCFHIDPRLFVLFHATRLKSLLHRHTQNPRENVLSDHLDLMLESLCCLVPAYQPDAFRTGVRVVPISTAYASTFFRLHQGLKIQALLLCTRPQHV